MNLHIAFNGYDQNLQGWHVEHGDDFDETPTSSIHYKDGIRHNENGPAVVAFKTIRDADPGILPRKIPDFSSIKFYLHGQQVGQDVWEQKTAKKWCPENHALSAPGITLPVLG